MHKTPAKYLFLLSFRGLRHFLFQNTDMNVEIRTGIVIFFPSFDADSFSRKTWIEPNLHNIGKQL